MKKNRCPRGFIFDKNIRGCLQKPGYFPSWISYQKISEYIENKLPKLTTTFDEYGLIGIKSNKKAHLDIFGDDEAMQKTPYGWDVDIAQNPECKTENIMDFFAVLYPKDKWEQVFSNMFHSGPHMFTSEERYHMQNLVKTK